MRHGGNDTTAAKTPLVNASPRHAFSSAQALGRALSRVRKMLPKSPRKKAAVVRKLALGCNFEAGKVACDKTNEVKETDQQVIAFYLSDLISRQLAGKKDFITVKTEDGNKERLQKRILMMTVREAYRLFKEEHHDVVIGKSKFAQLRPKNVMPVNDKDQSVCCCKYHENLDLLLAGLRKSVCLNIPNERQVIEKSVCGWNKDCYFGNCEKCSNVDSVIDDMLKTYTPKESNPSEEMENEVQYYQWTALSSKEAVTCSLQEKKKELGRQLVFVKKHSYIAKMQLQQIKSLKVSMREHEAIIQEDFSENFAIKHQNEIMSAHWVSHGVTLFTAIVYQANDATSYVVVSDELQHDKYAVNCFNKAILHHYASVLGRKIEYLHVFSDGAASQFKNRYTLSTILNPKQFHASIDQMDWSFFASAHGKGPIDGIGGTMKRTVWRRILQGRVVVNNASDFAEVAKEACPNINVIVVGVDEVSKCKSSLETMWQSSPPSAIRQTHSMHYARAHTAHVLEVGDISPFIEGTAVNFSKARIFGMDSDGDEEAVKKSSETMEPAKDVSSAVHLVGSYVMVEYDNVCYPGVIEELRDNQYLVSVLERCRGGWRWPRRKDMIWYNSIVKTLSPPTPVNSRGLFAFNETI
jgi:hypothetical protein